MTMPDWWTRRRLGLMVTASAATVPAWSPIGERAEWYRSHLGEEVADRVVHPSPMVEVLAHHRDRWGHIERYDDFVDLLSFDRFDPETWAELADALGAGYTVFTSRHHDGWAWWDAPGTTNLLTERGPRRNVLAEYAAACERHEIVFGTACSLLDWGDDRYPSDTFVSESLHPQVLDLVERYGSTMLWGDGEWGHDAGVWQTGSLMEQVRAVDPDIVINDRWRASSSDVPDGAPDIVRTFEVECPAEIVDGPWELRRPVAHSFGHNRAERAEHHLTAAEIVDLYTEVLAKGGHLLLGVGPAADGTIPDLQAQPLRDAGAWIRSHDRLLAPCRPWTHWGDRDVRYLDAGDEIVALDLTGRGRFDALDSTRHLVASVVDADGNDLPFEQDATGLVVTGATTTSDTPSIVAICRIRLSPAPPPEALFALDAAGAVPLAPLLAGAQPGAVVQLGDGTYEGPAVVPDGVTVRGLGPTRTVIRSALATSPSIVPSGPTLTVGRNARVEHLRISETTPEPTLVAPVSIAIDHDAATILGCTVDGTVAVTGDDVLLRAVTGRSVRAHDADRLHVSRCQFSGSRSDVGVELIGGGGQHIESSRFVGHLCAVRLTETTGTTVRGNAMRSRWWGVHLERTESAHVHGNRVGWTMRAVDVDAGRAAVVDGNSVHDGDSGCIVENGAADCEIYGNHWDRCRIGLLAWNATSLEHQDNVCSDLHEPDGAWITGP